MHHKWKEIIDIVCKTPMENHCGINSMMKSLIEVKDDFSELACYFLLLVYSRMMMLWFIVYRCLCTGETA